MSSKLTPTHRLSSPSDHPQTALDPAQTQQRDWVQKDEGAPRSRLLEKLLDLHQVPSEWRMGSDEELLLRLKAQEMIGEKAKGRCSESTEAQWQPLLPRPNPKPSPKRVKSPTSDEVTEVCRSATSSVTLPRQRISGSNLPQNPSSGAGKNQTSWEENHFTQGHTLLRNQEKQLANLVKPVYLEELKFPQIQSLQGNQEAQTRLTKAEEASRKSALRLENALEKLTNAISALSKKGDEPASSLRPNTPL